MKKILLISAILLNLVIGACDGTSKSNLSEEQATAIVIDSHAGNIGNVEIISVNLEENKYIVKWENKENCESGTEYIDAETGEVIKGEVSIC